MRDDDVVAAAARLSDSLEVERELELEGGQGTKEIAIQDATTNNNIHRRLSYN